MKTIVSAVVRNVVIYFATKWTINSAVYLYERVQARRAKRESAPEQT